MGARNMDLNVAITDNTRYRNHAKEEDDDLNPAFLGAQLCLGAAEFNPFASGQTAVSSRYVNKPKGN